MQTQTISMEHLAGMIGLQLEHGYATLAVTGVSMLPMLRHGRDFVRLERLERPIRPGDILLYRRKNGQYILHRVVKQKTASEVLCCGDNQWEKEEVLPSQVVGVVCAFCRRGKWYAIEHPVYQLYVRLWVGLFPIRRPILSLRRKLGRLRRQFKKQMYKHSRCGQSQWGTVTNQNVNAAIKCDRRK